jgi:hypothetical protein
VREEGLFEFLLFFISFFKYSSLFCYNKSMGKPQYFQKNRKNRNNKNTQQKYVQKTPAAFFIVLLVGFVVISVSGYYFLKYKDSSQQYLGLENDAADIPSTPDKKTDSSAPTSSAKATIALPKVTFEELLNIEIPISSGSPIGSIKESVDTVITLVNGRHQLTASEVDACINSDGSNCYIQLAASKPSDIVYARVNNRSYAIVVINNRLGGNGLLSHLAVFKKENNKSVFVASKYLGDRIIIESITAESGIITINLTNRDELHQTFRYELSGDQLVRLY